MEPVLIFVVDDDAQVQSMLEAALEDGGFAVALAADGEKAKAMLDADYDKFRAVITDVNLGPGEITGWDVAKHARERASEMPIIYMTGASAHEWASLGVPNSVLIQKPFAIAQVTTALANLLNTGGPTPVVAT